MAKKIVRLKGNEEPSAYVFNFKHMAQFVFMTFLAASGVAAIVQTLLLQWSFGLGWGILGFFIAFLLLGVAKHIKWNLYGHMHHCNCK